MYGREPLAVQLQEEKREAAILCESAGPSQQKREAAVPRERAGSSQQVAGSELLEVTEIPPALGSIYDDTQLRLNEQEKAPPWISLG